MPACHRLCRDHHNLSTLCTSSIIFTLSPSIHLVRAQFWRYPRFCYIFSQRLPTYILLPACLSFAQNPYNSTPFWIPIYTHTYWFAGLRAPRSGPPTVADICICRPSSYYSLCHLTDTDVDCITTIADHAIVQTPVCRWLLRRDSAHWYTLSFGWACTCKQYTAHANFALTYILSFFLW